jgi:hypothetical protein
MSWAREIDQENGKRRIATDKCALTNCDVIQVRFLLWQSISASLTSTASPEKVVWEAEGKGET